MKIKVFSSKLAMGDLHHAVTSLVIDLKRRQPIRLTKKQTWTHKYFSERKSSRNHRWSRQQDNHRIPIFFLNITTKMKRPMLWTINPSRMVVWSGLIKSAFGPYFWQTPANLELSFSILTNEPHEAGWTSIWPLRYWTTASPVMLSAVVTWNVLPFFFLLQWNLSWVKDKTDLSSFMAVFVRTIWSLVIPRYEALTGGWEGGVEPITTLETRSHPPEMKSCFLIRKNNRF